MSHNPIIPQPSHGGILNMPSKQGPSGDQTSGSVPNIFANPSQPLRPSFQHPGNNGISSPYNPNGHPNSPASTPSPYTSSPLLKGPIPNNIYNNNASPLSSRNSSPAMNQSSPSLQNSTPQSNPFKPIPQMPPGLSQNRTVLPNYPHSGPIIGPSTLNSSNPVLSTTSSINPSVSTNQPIPFVPQPKSFPQSQSNVSYPHIPSQVNNPMAPISQANMNMGSLPTVQFPPQKSMNPLPPTSFINANSSPAHVNTNYPPTTAFPNWQINPNAPPLIPSQAPASLNFQPSIGSAINSQQGTGSSMNQSYPSSQRDTIQNVPYPPGGIYNQRNTLSNQPNLPNPPSGSQPGLQPRLPPTISQLPPYQNSPQASLPPSQYPSDLGMVPPLVPPGQPWNQQPTTQQYNNGQPELTQQMGRMSVAHNSFSQLWGQESVDLLQCRNVLPEEKLPAPTVKLNHQFSQSVNCSPDIFRCTLTKIPESNSLLQKSRLPLGILIHPFKDLNHLPVIQCSSIVRCRACRTYINPFVYFVDLKRWKCNLCYRVNDLPEEFQYDPVSKTYGEPRRRPEIQSATLEYVAPSEYMLRPPQPAAYTFVLDVSIEGARSGYLSLLCATLKAHLTQLPGDSRTMVAFICYDHAVHYYSMSGSKPTQMTVIDIDDIFVPSPEDLLVNLVEKRTAVEELLESLPGLHANPSPSSTRSALGAALQAAHKLTAPTGGRITVFQTCLTNVGPGGLTAREDPNNRSSKEVAHLNPATDFYKRLALDCSGVQVAVDLFLLNSQYADLSTLSGISQFSGGSVYHFPLFRADREWQAQELQRCLTRYLTRKIGFEAVMRVRCTRGVAIHTFHGSFFVRSTDLLSLPNVSPDSGFGMQLSIEESLADVQHVCFQAALLYTSSKGERRIRVHTMCLPVVNTLSEIIHSADQQCIVGLLAKMGVDRSLTSSLSDAREALLNAAVDALGAQRITSGPTSGLMAPVSLRLMPLYLLALLKHPAFRTGTSTRLDDRVAAMCAMKSLPLPSLIRTIYPDLYPVHRLAQYLQPVADGTEGQQESVPCPPRLYLSAEKVNTNGAYLLDQESTMLLYVGNRVDPQWLQAALGVAHPSLISPEGWHSLPTLDTEENGLLHAFIHHLNDDRPFAAPIQVILDSASNRALFTEKLLDDRVESAMSYHEFLQHIKSQLK